MYSLTAATWSLGCRKAKVRGRILSPGNIIRRQRDGLPLTEAFAFPSTTGCICCCRVTKSLPHPQVGAVHPIYNAQDERIMTLDTHAGGRVNIYPLDCGKYLVSMVPNTILGDEISNLYLWEAGKLMHMMNGCLNRRLRKMHQLRKWKRVGGV